MPMPGGTYWVAKVGDEHVGGIFESAATTTTVSRRLDVGISRSMTSTLGLKRRSRPAPKVMKEPFERTRRRRPHRYPLARDRRGARGWITPAAAQ